MYLRKVQAVSAPGSAGVVRMLVIIAVFFMIAGIIASQVTKAQRQVYDQVAAAAAEVEKPPITLASYQDDLSSQLSVIATELDLESLGVDPAIAALATGLMTSTDLMLCEAENSPGNIQRAEALGQSFSSALGLSASPMFGFLAVNVVKRARCGWILEDEHLPWFMKNEVFFVLCAAALIVLFKDLLLSWLPVLKAPIDGLEQILKVAVAVITIPTIATLFAASASGGLAASGTSPPVATIDDRPFIQAEASPRLEPVVLVMPSGHAAASGRFAGRQAPAEVTVMTGGPGFLTNFALASVGLFVTLVMWVSAGFVGGLVLLMPVPLFDSFLRGARAAFIVGIVALAIFAPVVALWLGLPVFLLALWMFPWSFRLLSFAVMNAGDFILFRIGRGNGSRQWYRAFSGQALRELPRRTAGRLVNAEDGQGLVFSYSPYFILPRRAVRIDGKEELCVVEGVLMPSLRLGFGGTGPAAFLMPARYRKHGEDIARKLGLGYSRKSIDGTVSMQTVTPV